MDQTEKRRKTLIIGGVAGGATTAARLRRRDNKREIIIFEKGDYISYANCGLPYYIGGVIRDREALLLMDPQTMRERFDIDVRTANEVTSIQRENKTVTVTDRKKGISYEESYDDLVIATGSVPVVPPIPGIEGKGIHTLWTIPDTDQIKRIVDEENPVSAAVIGGGFIGLEMAENLQAAGLKVTIIEMQNQVMAPLDFEMAELLHENIIMNGADLILEDGVAAFEERAEGGTRIRLQSGRTVNADLVLLSIGVKPNSALASAAGLQLNAKGGIVTDRFLKTSDENIYAVGDVIEVENQVTGMPAMIPLAGPANREARICADNLAGDRKEYRGTQGTSVAKVFDYAAAVTGLNEKALQAIGKKKDHDYYSVLISQRSHAGYYPGSSVLYLKLIFDAEGRILGAQAVGPDGADKRIDVIASVMRQKGTIQDLEEQESAYAPPFSSAKDPVNMLGFAAENVLDGLVSFISCAELDRQRTKEGAKETLTILDVREPAEFEVYHIPGSIHIPLGELSGRLNELDQEKMIAVICAAGVRAYNAARILMQNDFSQVKVMEGGMQFYRSMHFRECSLGTGNETCGCREADDMIENNSGEVVCVDCSGLQCPGPIVKVHEELGRLKDGEVLQVTATDMGFVRDIEAWCRQTGNVLLKAEKNGCGHTVQIRKGSGSHKTQERELTDGKTMVVFSGDMDKVLASFIIANGAAAMGRPVTMFFTFWGLNVLRKPEKQNVKKNMVEKMFGVMMPRGSRKLKLSKMNMGGMGTAMMKRVMKQKNVDSLEQLMMQARKNGVKFVACTMSMDVMGIRKEEIIDGVEFAGVASYLGDAEHSNVNLFI